MAPSILEILPFLNKSWLDLNTFHEHIHALNTLVERQSAYKNVFDLSHLESVQKSVKMAIICHQYQGSIYEKYGHLLGKELSGIKREIKKWKALNQALELLDVENYHWKQEPSIAELEILKSASQEKGWVASLRWKRLWNKWTRSPELNPLTSIASKENQLNLRSDVKKRSHKFDSLGITSIEIELPVIEQFIQHISMMDWTWYQALNPETRTEMAQANRSLNEYTHGLKSLFTLNASDDIEWVFTKLSASMNALEAGISRLNELSNETFDLLKTRKSNDELAAFVHQHHWNAFVSKHPYMLDFDLNEFKHEIKKEREEISYHLKSYQVNYNNEKSK